MREHHIPYRQLYLRVTASKILHTEHEYERTLAAVDESLKRFGFGEHVGAVCRLGAADFCADYLDLFLVHTPLSGKARRLETYRALLDAKKAGKLRSVGVSN